MIQKSINNSNITVAKKTKSSLLVSAKDLVNMPASSFSYLWGNYIQSDSLCAITGSSDAGKTSILRQLAISIATKQSTFLGQKLNARHGKVIYLSTEDGKKATAEHLKKQVGEDFANTDLNGLGFLFDVRNPVEVITNELQLAKFDLIIIDCFGDFFNGSINDSGQVRKALEPLKRLCFKHDCACIVLHHIGKRTESGPANKSNILGSTAFEGAMRFVMELRKEDGGKVRKLYFTKGNYLAESSKSKPMVLNFTDNQTFCINDNYNEGISSINGKVKVFSDNVKDEILEAAKGFRKDGLSLDDTLDALAELHFEKVPSKGTLHSWLKNAEIQSANPLDTELNEQKNIND